MLEYLLCSLKFPKWDRIVENNPIRQCPPVSFVIFSNFLISMLFGHPYTLHNWRGKGGGGMGEGAPPYLHYRDFSPRKGYLTHNFLLNFFTNFVIDCSWTRIWKHFWWRFEKNESFSSPGPPMGEMTKDLEVPPAMFDTWHVYLVSSSCKETLTESSLLRGDLCKSGPGHFASKKSFP